MRMRQTRREFMRSCALLALSGFGGAGALGGCGRASPPPGVAPGAAAGFEPVYLKLHRRGELLQRGETLWRMMERCTLCPRECGAKRLAGARGFCGASAQLEIASHHPHFGEERLLVGNGGSGTIFFSHCSLRCVFCINWEISQGGEGRARTVEDLAGMMLDLQRRGCHNINVVTPTHYSPQILLALDHAAGRVVPHRPHSQQGGWEKVSVLKLLDGVVDIYLPDFKYSDPAMAARYSAGASRYPAITRAAIVEMQRQVGTARPGTDGLVRRGLMVRHLVMPNGVSGTKGVIETIAAELPAETYLNIMAQYTPAYRASEYPEIARRITRQEYAEALRQARQAGLRPSEI